jgi:hypothetical protein
LGHVVYWFQQMAPIRTSVMRASVWPSLTRRAARKRLRCAGRESGIQDGVVVS